MDPDIEAKFNRYYELLSKNKDITETEKSEIVKLKNFLKDKYQMGTSLRDELMYTVIDELLAEKVLLNKKNFVRERLKAEVVQRVKDIWGNLNL